MKCTWYITVALALVLALAFAAPVSAQYGPKIYKPSGPAGGDSLNVASGGQVTVESGGVLDFRSGSYLKFNGTALTLSAAEANLLDGSVAGTAVASKALALGTSRNTNYFAVDDTLLLNTALARVLSGSTVDFESGSAFKIGGTSVTSDAAEHNLLDGSVAGTAVAGKALALGAGRNTNYLSIGDTLVVKPSATSDVADSSLVFTIENGQPVIKMRGEDDDAAEITMNTSDQIVFQNAGNGYLFDGPLLGKTEVRAITAEADTLSTAESGYLLVARPIAQKSTLQLPAAAKGLSYTVMVDDADSLLIRVADGDSLVASDGTACVVATSVAGNVKLIAIDTVRWLMLNAVGTWTNY